VKKLHTQLCGTAVLLCAGIAAGFTAPDSSLPMLGAAGTAELRAGNYAAALAALAATRDVPDTCYHLLKIGIASYQTNAHSKALAALQKVAARCPDLAACSYEHIALTELAMGRTANALTAYRSALSSPAPLRYRTELQNAVSDIVRTNAIDTAEHAWLSPWYRPVMPQTDSAQRAALTERIAQQRWAGLDSLVNLALDSTAKRAACNLLSLVPLDSIPRDAISTARLFEGATKLRSCGSARVAGQWLARASSRADFAREVNPARAVYLRGMLAYAMGNNEDAVKWLRHYERDNAPTPEVVMTIARAYRAMDRGVKSAEWYDKHIQLFPKHNQTQEILWYRAWQREENGQLRSAIALYRRIRQQYRTAARAPEAYFREGLLQFRNGRADSARVAWNGLLKAYPQSSLLTAARYWNGRALLAMQQRDEALVALREVVTKDPLDYYSYRAQDILRDQGDTVQLLRFVPGTDPEWARQWLDSVGERKPLSAQDSSNYRTGVQMATVGLGRHAEYYLEPLLLSYTTNLAFQFELAWMLAHCGMPTLSYRAARPLAWRIPPEQRAGLPRSVLTVLYPRAFDHLIDSAAAQFGIEQNLISAIIRQESMFDPLIESPAGAIGLMQIMPFTGKDLARALSEPFDPDSLRNPETNVRFGSYYVHTLLEKFDGKIVLVLAGYNGGPHNAKRWYDANRDVDFDTFVENISYTETRGYVKRVLANYWTYNRVVGQLLHAGISR
jgi:soluble lytic murein transglycosylase-like protein